MRSYVTERIGRGALEEALAKWEQKRELLRFRSISRGIGVGVADRLVLVAINIRRVSRGKPLGLLTIYFFKKRGDGLPFSVVHGHGPSFARNARSALHPHGDRLPPAL